MQKMITIEQFKDKCLELIDDIQKKQLTLVITKHGVPIAKLVPADDVPINLFGALKGAIKIKADIISSIEEP